MANIIISFALAFWLGILTSISPCPLATNIAAVSFLSKKIAHPKIILLSGIFYSLGRMLVYAILGFLIIKSFFSMPVLANFLQKYMNKILGPILIITGLFLLDILKLNFLSFSLASEKHSKLAESGIRGAFMLGAIFALSFCPVSAALFFGSLIPLSLSNKLGIILPFIYGVATGLPVLIFALLVCFGIKGVAGWFHKVSQLEIYARKTTGAIFILAGLYYLLIYLK